MEHVTTVEELIKFLKKYDPGSKITFLVDGCQAVKVWEMYGDKTPVITLRTVIEKIEPKDHVEIWDDLPEGA